MQPQEVQKLVHELQIHQVELEVQNEELRRTQVELQQARDRYANLFNFAPIGYLTLDNTGTIHEANFAAGYLLGMDQKRLTSMRLFELFAPDERKSYEHFMRRVSADILPHSLETALIKGDGGKLNVDLYAVSMHNEDGATVGCRVAIMDLTERMMGRESHRQLEDQLRHEQKMAAIGQLAGGVAHEFNNILSVILMQAEMLKTKARQISDGGASFEAGLDRVMIAGEKARQLTHHLLSFARRKAPKPVIISLNQLILTGMENYKRLFREQIRSVVNLARDTKPIFADPSQVEQVLLNLLLNAVDSIEENGQITVETTNVKLTSAYCAARPNVHPGEYVLMKVKDTGTGMDQPTRERMFEPFFTTKPVGKGTGLGLSVVHGLVEQAGGHITVDTKPGAGTTLTVYFPATDALFQEPQSPSISEEIPAGRETILLCEDEPLVRESMRDVLQSFGYKVVVAECANDAIALANSMNGELALLITDVIMPDMKGPDLVVALRKKQKDLPAILISGYTAEVLDSQHPAMVNSIFMEKPVPPRLLGQRIRELLAARTS